MAKGRVLITGASRESAKPAHCGRLIPVIIDVTDPDSIAAVARSLAGQPLAGLVNNAGVNVSAPVELVPLDRLRFQLEVNVIGQVAVTQAFLPIGSIGGRGVVQRIEVRFGGHQRRAAPRVKAAGH